MHTDKLIYHLLKFAPQGFFALIGRNPDDASRYQFTSVEIKETAFRIDSVFIPNDKADITYFVEAQFQTDEQFYERFFAEIFFYIRQNPTNQWKAIVIYPSRSVEQKETKLYATLLASEDVKRVYLDELPESDFIASALFELLIVPETRLEGRVRKIAQAANQLELSLLVKILSYKNLTKEEVRNMLGIEKDLFQETVFYKEVFEEGKQAGKQEGKQEGEYLTKLSMVPLLRELGLSDMQIAQKLQLPLSDIQQVKK